MKTRKQNRNNKRTDIERFAWFIERIQTHVAFGWLSERSRRLGRYTATRLVNRTMPSSIHITVFFGRKTKSPCFELFIPWFIKQMTNIYGSHFPRSYESRSLSLLFCFVCFFVFSFCVTPEAPRASMWEARSLSFD